MACLSLQVVLFLDDLQWVDEGSWDIIKNCIEDTKNTAILIVINYRQEEIVNSHPLAVDIQKIQTGGSKITRVELSELHEEAVNYLVSDALCMSRRLTRPLANLIHIKTHGNAFFVVQCLRSLLDEGLISYVADSNRWHWDDDELHMTKLSDNVAELLMGKLQKLPIEMQDVLKKAACVGTDFSERTMYLLFGEGLPNAEVQTSGKLNRQSLSRPALGKMLTVLDTEGIIIHSFSLAKGSRYKFAHDKFWQAAYSLIPKVEKSYLHLHIGRILYNDASNEGDLNDRNKQQRLFCIADQFSKGVSHINTEKEQLDVARLNLLAGEIAMKSSAFVPAAFYLKAGIKLLGNEKQWSTNYYDMTLRLFNFLAEAELVNGNMDKADQVITEILHKARQLLDKFGAYIVLVKSFIAKGDLTQAMHTGFSVLSLLGEPFPTKVSGKHLLRQYTKTKRMCHGKTDSEILQLPGMSSPLKTAAMQMLGTMWSVPASLFFISFSLFYW